jgi:hypothetical protein
MEPPRNENHVHNGGGKASYMEQFRQLGKRVVWWVDVQEFRLVSIAEIIKLADGLPPLYNFLQNLIVSTIKSKKEFCMAAKFEIFLDRKKQYRFHLKASNGEIFAAS